MPTYDYRCHECEHTFEEFQSMSADPLETCPECKGRVERLIGAGIGLIFKGSGFYLTDYKNKKGSSSDAKSEKKSSDSSKKETAGKKKEKAAKSD